MAWWRSRSTNDFAEELASHLELEVERNLSMGMAPDEARHAARRTLGNLTQAQERFFESRRAFWLERIWGHLRYATRGLLAHPAFTLTAVLTLAFGIGLNTALFTVVYSFLFRPLPVRESERVVNVHRELRGTYSLDVDGRASMLSYPGYLRLREASATVENLAVYRGQDLTMLSGEGSTHVSGAIASCNYFAALYVRMAHGRAFAPDECAHAGESAVAVLSHALWQRQFGGDSSVVRRAVVLNRVPFTVIGVAEPGFTGTEFEGADVWIPLTMFPSLSAQKTDRLTSDMSWLAAVGRLRSGASITAAREELGAIARREDVEFPGRTTVLSVVPGAMLNFPEALSEGALVLGCVFGAALLVLIMACANVMNLLLARAATRRREIGIRLSLGATRRELIGQLMVESVVLALVGGAAGVVMAYWIPPLLVVAIPQNNLHFDLSPNLPVLAYALLFSLGTALLFGLLPALQATDLQLTSAMRNETTRGARRTSATRMRGVAVCVQVATSVVLLVVAGLFVRATQRALGSNPGFETNGVVTLGLNLEQSGYDSTRARLFLDELRQRLAATPGVSSVAFARMLPFRGRMTTSVRTDLSRPSTEYDFQMSFNVVSAGYLATLGIPVVRGRAIGEQDERAAGPAAAVVSESFARIAWGSADPIGRQFDAGERFEVVGVARDVQSLSVGAPDGAFVYQAARPGALLGMTVVVRTPASAATTIAAADRIVRALDPTVLVEGETLAERLARQLRPVQVGTMFATALGVLALLLALVGVYGVVNYGVSQRSKEIGVRMALGASRRNVHTLVLRDGGRFVAIGLGVGIVIAAAAAQVIRSFLFGVSPLDPVAFLVVAVVLTAAAALAVWAPARRAARLDPVIALREE